MCTSGTSGTRQVRGGGGDGDGIGVVMLLVVEIKASNTSGQVHNITKTLRRSQIGDSHRLSSLAKRGRC